MYRVYQELHPIAGNRPGWNGLNTLGFYILTEIKIRGRADVVVPQSKLKFHL